MKSICMDQEWTFRRGFCDSLSALDATHGTIVNLPHDGMIGTSVSPDAPGQADHAVIIQDPFPGEVFPGL